MRFSHFLKYNAVPEWQSHYMDYNGLKDKIYTIQTDELKRQGIDPDQFLNDTDNENDNENNGSSSKNWKQKLLFLKKKNQNDKKVQDDDINNLVMEETIELNDFQQHNLDESSIHKNTFQRVRDKFFDKRSISSSLDSKDFNPYDIFVNDLSQEREKVDDFYKRTEDKFYIKFDKLVKDLETEQINVTNTNKSSNLNFINTNNNSSIEKEKFNEEITSQLGPEETADDEDDYLENDEFADTPENTALLHYSQFNVESQKKSILKTNIINLYIDLSQLKAFIELNKMGFSKITKKADKVLILNIKAELIQTGAFYKGIHIFEKETFTILSEKINQLIKFYAIITNQSNNFLEAKDELKNALHDHIVWERSNTWKDMLGLLSQENGLVSDLPDNDPNKVLLGKLQLEYYKIPLPITIDLKKWQFNSIWLPKLFFGWMAFKLGFIILVTGILLGIKTFNDPVKHRCMALVECVAFLWASEALPLHITAFLVPLLVVLFKVLLDEDGKVMGAAAASSEILSTMWSSTIIILLAGFTLGEVLSQYNIAKVIASWVFAVAGTKPRNILLVAMAVVFFLSMWISNVAAPVLTYSLLQPVLETLEADQPFGKALVLCVAIGANIGGMSSPISSPQNIISMDYLTPYNIGWGQFFAVALPTGIIATFCCWILLFTTFDISSTKIEKFKPIRTQFTLKQWFICGVTLATIILWCVEKQIESAFGSSGIIAILPIAIFFGSGLLSTKDFNTFPWSIVLLAMGGTALGKGVSSSGLLAAIAEALEKRVEKDSPMAVLCIFGALMLVVGTFVSHTVSAIIIVPLVQEVGNKLSNPKAAPLLVFGCSLLASAGMGLASSGFPNVTAISMLDKKGNRYLSMSTFMSRGIPCSIIVYVCVITIGYGITISVVHPQAST